MLTKRKKCLAASAAVVVMLFILYGSEKLEGIKKENDQKAEGIQAVEMESLKEEGEEDKAHEIDDKKSVEAEKKIELTDYAGLAIDDFIKETGIPLRHEHDEVWRTEDETIWLGVDDGRIINLSLYKKEDGGEPEEKADMEDVSYTVAGINLDDKVIDLEKTILKDAVYSSDASGYDDYTGIYLSSLGIERLTLVNMGTVDSIHAYFDMSLKENAEGLEYLWEEKVLQKEGVQNSSLETCEEPYAEMPEQYKHQENIDKTFVWIKYPCIEIPGKPEMTQNANNLILETVERIEEKTYRNTDENVVVEAEYMITYMTSKFISITFRVDVSCNDDSAASPWQFCNINMAENGRGALLADVGITRERVEAACSARIEPMDVEGYLEKYDTGWDQYRILPTEYRLYVPALNEDTGLPNTDTVTSVRMNKY